MRRADPPVYRACPTTALVAWRAGAQLRATTWTAWDALIAMLGGIVVTTAAALALALAGIGDTGVAGLLLMGVSWVVMLGWPLWVTRRRGNGFRIDLGPDLTWAQLGKGAAGGLGAFALAVVLGIVSTLLLGEFTSAAGDAAEGLAGTGPGWTVPAFALMVVVGAPIVEETVFRGLLWSGLVKRGVRPLPACLISALAFAAAHFEPQRLLVLLGVGLSLGLVRWWSGSLGSAMVAHAVVNLPGGLAILAMA